MNEKEPVMEWTIKKKWQNKEEDFAQEDEVSFRDGPSLSRDVERSDQNIIYIDR